MKKNQKSSGSSQKKNNKKEDYHKKTDGDIKSGGKIMGHDDEESKGFVEKQIQKENSSKIDILERNVSAIKSLTSGIQSQMKDDDKVISGLSSGFDRSKALV